MFSYQTTAPLENGLTESWSNSSSGGTTQTFGDNGWGEDRYDWKSRTNTESGGETYSLGANGGWTKSGKNKGGGTGSFDGGGNDQGNFNGGGEGGFTEAEGADGVYLKEASASGTTNAWDGVGSFSYNESYSRTEKISRNASGGTTEGTIYIGDTVADKWIDASGNSPEPQIYDTGDAWRNIEAYATSVNTTTTATESLDVNSPTFTSQSGWVYRVGTTSTKTETGVTQINSSQGSTTLTKTFATTTTSAWTASVVSDTEAQTTLTVTSNTTAPRNIQKNTQHTVVFLEDGETLYTLKSNAAIGQEGTVLPATNMWWVGYGAQAAVPEVMDSFVGPATITITGRPSTTFEKPVFDATENCKIGWEWAFSEKTNTLQFVQVERIQTTFHGLEYGYMGRQSSLPLKSSPATTELGEWLGQSYAVGGAEGTRLIVLTDTQPQGVDAGSFKEKTPTKTVVEYGQADFFGTVTIGNKEFTVNPIIVKSTRTIQVPHVNSGSYQDNWGHENLGEQYTVGYFNDCTPELGERENDGYGESFQIANAGANGAGGNFDLALNLTPKSIDYYGYYNGWYNLRAIGAMIVHANNWAIAGGESCEPKASFTIDNQPKVTWDVLSMSAGVKTPAPGFYTTKTGFSTSSWAIWGDEYRSVISDSSSRTIETTKISAGGDSYRKLVFPNAFAGGSPRLPSFLKGKNVVTVGGRAHIDEYLTQVVMPGDFVEETITAPKHFSGSEIPVSTWTPQDKAMVVYDVGGWDVWSIVAGRDNNNFYP